MRTRSLPQYATAFIATIYTPVHPQAHEAKAMSVGEMTDQDFPDRPSYDWLQAHEDNSLPAEYGPGREDSRSQRPPSLLMRKGAGERTPPALDQVSGPWNGPVR